MNSNVNERRTIRLSTKLINTKKNETTVAYKQTTKCGQIYRIKKIIDLKKAKYK